MIFAILGILLSLGIIGGGGFIMFKILQETDPLKVDTSIGKRIETAQEFLPFEDITNNMLDLGGHQYRMYIEVSSINYFLRSEAEQKLINMSYQRFINSLSYPITIFVQTRVANNEELLEKLQEDYLRTSDRYPGLREYAEDNFEEMLLLYQQRGTDREKRKYIIVSFDDARSMTELNDEEKLNYAYEELTHRCKIILDGLSGVGLSAKILTTTEIAELLLSTYHKRNYSHLKALIGGEYTPLIVDGTNHIANEPDDGRLDWVLWEAQNKLSQEILDLSDDQEICLRTKQVIKEIEKTRQELAGYYKEHRIQ